MKKLFENKIFKTVFGIVRTIFYILLVIYLVFAIVERVSQNGIKGYRIYTIRTGSMDPAYKVYDVILVKETNPDDLRVGDVITYANTNYTVTHRIVFINDQNGEITADLPEGLYKAIEVQASDIKYDITNAYKSIFKIGSAVNKSQMRKYNKNFKSCHQSIIIPLGLLMLQAPPTMREKSPSEILTARLAL